MESCKGLAWWGHKECLEEPSLLVTLWSAHHKPVDGRTSIDGWYARWGGSSLDVSHWTAVLAYSIDTNLTLNQTIHCVHMEVEGEEMAPDKAFLHYHPLSVLIDLFYCYLHHLIPIILFFCLLALLPDAEVIWSRVRSSWQSNVSLVCRGASRSFSHTSSSVQWTWHFAQLPPKDTTG